MLGKMVSLFAVLTLSSCTDPKYVQNTLPQQLESIRISEKPNATFPESKNGVLLTWEKMPTSDEFGSAIIKTGRVNTPDGTLTLEDMNGDLAVVLWMPSMGHGSSPVKVERLGEGIYRASQIFFSMPGDWEIRIQRKNGDQVLDQAIIAIRI